MEVESTGAISGMINIRKTEPITKRTAVTGSNTTTRSHGKIMKKDFGMQESVKNSSDVKEFVATTSGVGGMEPILGKGPSASNFDESSPADGVMVASLVGADQNVTVPSTASACKVSIDGYAAAAAPSNDEMKKISLADLVVELTAQLSQAIHDTMIDPKEVDTWGAAGASVDGYAAAAAHVPDKMKKVSLADLTADLMAELNGATHSAMIDPREVEAIINRAGVNERAAMATVTAHGKSNIREVDATMKELAVTGSVVATAVAPSGNGMKKDLPVGDFIEKSSYPTKSFARASEVGGGGKDPTLGKGALASNFDELMAWLMGEPTTQSSTTGGQTYGGEEDAGEFNVKDLIEQLSMNPRG